jgi:hypothetical protein
MIMDKQAIQRWLGLVSFTVGLLLGLLLIAVPVWADLEASYYGFQPFYAETLPSLHCPVLMERSETGKMWVTVRNKAEREVNQVVLVRLSSPLSIIESKETLTLAPGETRRLTWEINQSNIDLGTFMFAHVATYPVYPVPMREATCGVFVVDFPGLPGNVLFYGLLGLCVLCLGVGLLLWDTSRISAISQLPQVRMAMSFLVVVLLVGMVSSLAGWWMVGVVALVVVLLAITTLMYMATTG